MVRQSGGLSLKRGVIPAVTLFVFVAAGSAVIAARFTRDGGPSSFAPAPNAALFNSQCAKCHGRDGQAQTKEGRKTHTRDITRGEWQDDVSDERIFNSIRRGKGKMPAFAKLSDAQIDSLVTYVRRLRK